MEGFRMPGSAEDWPFRRGDGLIDLAKASARADAAATARTFNAFFTRGAIG
jgi:hypothetical protein